MGVELGPGGPYVFRTIPIHQRSLAQGSSVSVDNHAATVTRFIPPRPACCSPAASWTSAPELCVLPNER